VTRCRREDDWLVAAHEFAEGLLIVLLYKESEQLGVR
jgi:hypothetical protein